MTTANTLGGGGLTLTEARILGERIDLLIRGHFHKRIWPQDCPCAAVAMTPWASKCGTKNPARLT